jgi:hypothetical protein
VIINVISFRAVGYIQCMIQLLFQFIDQQHRTKMF